jgi:hypothetical protein
MGNRKSIGGLTSPRRRRTPSTITVRFRCATCGGDHLTHTHQLDATAQRLETERVASKTRDLTARPLRAATTRTDALPSGGGWL